MIMTLVTMIMLFELPLLIKVSPLKSVPLPGSILPRLVYAEGTRQAMVIGACLLLSIMYSSRE